VKGRKRHLLVDTQGLVMKVKVHPANIHDKTGAKLLLAPLEGQFPRMAKVWGDSAYRGLEEWMETRLGWELEVVKHWWTGVRGFWMPEDCDVEPPELPSGFHVLPRRWVVERTFAWLGRNRRLSKDYEYLPESEEAFVYAGMIRLLVRRLAKSGAS
jgi:transposase